MKIFFFSKKYFQNFFKTCYTVKKVLLVGGISLNVLESLEWTNWKNYSSKTKRDLFSQVLLYFVSPLRRVSNITLSQFELAGVKCETFEVDLDDETFVFLPGKKGAILGWDSGTQPLPAFYWDKKNLITNLIVEDYIKNYGLNTTQEWDTFVNESTSSLRQVDIAPMLVQKYPIPTGCRFIGHLNAVTGEFIGAVEAYSIVEKDILSYLEAPQTFEATLNFEFPSEIFQENQFYAVLNPEKERYTIYTHQVCSQEELIKELNSQVYDLLSEDQWEYAVGATTRRLFRWGNELVEDHSFWQNQTHRLVSRPNMFGLSFAGNNHRYEITCGNQLKQDKWTNCRVPLLDYLPLSTYYRARKILSKQERLSPKDYLYRKAIIIDQLS